MKRLILAIVLLMTCSCIYAQSDTIVSVCVDGESLDNILTDEEINSVTRLKITGTLTEADYACLRTMFCKKLVELNLHDADIDTIPANALELDELLKNTKITLPIALKHLSDSSLCVGSYHGNRHTLVLPGKYPTLGKCVYSKYGENHPNVCIEIPAENEFCKEEDGCVYSADGTVFYYMNEPYLGDEIRKIKHGTKIINACAFECYYNYAVTEIYIPETVDSIGDRAFYEYCKPEITGYLPKDFYPHFYCMALIPPMLGEDALCRIPSRLMLIVPDESFRLYVEAEGWKNFSVIRNVSGTDCVGGIANISNDGRITLHYDNSQYRIISRSNIRHAGLYSVDGKQIMSLKDCGTELLIDRPLLASPYTLLRMAFDDGNVETVKLMP